MMKTLSTEIRRHLERTVVEARDVAEAGARAALEALAVHHHEAYGHMSEGQRALRRRLRAHARQLGDRRGTGSGKQAITHLVHECAYEQWHAMLFARFLAENHLLIEPELGVAITLEECEELAKDAGIDKWVMAGRFAHQMLPQVFRPDHPVFEVRFAREHQLELERLVESLPAEVFTATDSLGWVYQFWQSKKKSEVNRSEVKIGADELPAVTQLFTEPYMVSFLLDNALGAWWATRRLSDADLSDAETETELRRKAAIPGVALHYLRFVRSEDTPEQEGWRPAAGAFDSWPEHLGDLKVIDPCCGSGHFLVAAFSMLVPMRMAREGFTARDAVDAVLRDNLHGLELDPRCVEVAAFALALAAWTYPEAEGYRPLPELNLACSGLAPNATKEEWTALSEQAAAAGGMPPGRDLFNVNDTLLSAPLRNSLGALHDLFGQAPELGSLINPRVLEDNLFQRDYESVRTLFAAVLARERTSDERTERAVTAQGMARAAELLAGRYHWVITNVPYLARGKQAEKLRTFCEQRYPAAKNDLATVFLERCLELCAGGGTASLALPQNWLFLASYRKLREKLLKKETWHLLARLGPGAFETISGEVVKAILLTLSRSNPTGHASGSFGEETPPSTMHGLDVSQFHTTGEKSARLLEAEIRSTEQAEQLGNPDARVSLQGLEKTERLTKFADSYLGLGTGDFDRFGRRIWEFPTRSENWSFLQSSAQQALKFNGLSLLVAWDPIANRVHGMDEGQRRRIHNQDQSGQLAWNRSGVAVTLMRELRTSVYLGGQYDKSVAVIVPREPRRTLAIFACCESPSFHARVREIDQKVIVANGTLTKVPFDFDYWQRVATKRYPNGLPRPYSDDPTQWIFHGHPCGSVVWDETAKRTVHGPLRTDSTVLQVAVARLLGYRWPAERDTSMELADEQQEWVRRCETLLDRADEDGIICISPVRGEPSAEDRLLGLLAAAFGDAWNDGVLSKLLAEASSPSLDDWLRNRFFEQHCQLFHNRPFIWHIWDGRRRDGFHALVNYHNLAEGDGKGRRCLESLTYSYLGDWITRQQDGVKRGEGGADDRLAVALELQKRLVAILEGDPPFDIFVRWKPIQEQPIGWEPDINAGVRLNSRPFLAADIPGGKKGAGIFRDKPNVHWRKDKGKEPLRNQEQFPWFWQNGEFTGERVNDVHLSIERKRTERERVEAQS